MSRYSVFAVVVLCGCNSSPSLPEVGSPAYAAMMQNLRGPKGDAGPQGERGPTGEQGPQGKDGLAAMISGSRLLARRWQLDDGSDVGAGLYDSKLSEPCTVSLRPDFDDVPRCYPAMTHFEYNAQETLYFADNECSERVIRDSAIQGASFVTIDEFVAADIVPVVYRLTDITKASYRKLGADCVATEQEHTARIAVDFDVTGFVGAVEKVSHFN